MNKQKGLITGIIVVALIIVLGFTSLFIVNEGEYKVVLQFGEAVEIYDDPGIKFKIPFIQSVTTLPKRQMLYDSNPTPILTKDKKPIEVDNYTVWRIADPKKFLQTAQIISNGEKRIDNAVYNTVRRKLSEIEYGDIISETGSARGDLNKLISDEVATVLERDEYGIEIVDVRIKRTDLPNENKESVFNRMISDRKAIAARYLSEGDEEYRKITSNADRLAKELIAEAQATSKKIIAEGEQEAASIYNAAYGKDPEFYSLYRTLESYITTFQGEPIIMMPINSPYASILLGR
ncbi:protease modulator HflC [Chengkuizengella axinellae]|uniref:Protein HflC n=1 Tax=Chengkuizengella axinellae TaxID=3064388 RepID=A0ABT9IZW4_9BACL|nr:protease modulator HflC [Chengkuizengella sp. 2205SS18-9]MDP5274682.1 protease modulator HflC [Chengkuizengella sp. 2205SS18-9]